jgi:CPA2 family monovalent cation:H+ antiporter-2
VLALPGAVEAREVLRLARAENPGILATVRTHTEEEAAWLEAEAGVHLVLMGEREVALGMADFALQRLGLPAALAQSTVDALRGARTPAPGMSCEPREPLAAGPRSPGDTPMRKGDPDGRRPHSQAADAGHAGPGG